MTEQPIDKPKRGRRSKKDILLANQLKNELINETLLLKSNNEEDDLSQSLSVCKIEENDEEIVEHVAKKRGRKPKGGKIIQQTIHLNNNKDSKPNIILHLKCSLKDLQINTLLSSNVESFNFSESKGDLSYEVINSSDSVFIKNSYLDVSNENCNNNSINNNNSTNNNSNKIFDCHSSNNYEDEEETCFNKDSETKEIWKKLKQLEHNLHINNISVLISRLYL